MAPPDLRSRARDLMRRPASNPSSRRRRWPRPPGRRPATDRRRGGRRQRPARLLWSSIDNPESRDLDQLEWAEPLGDGRARLRVAIADVDAQAPAGSAIDRHAAANTTSVYTGIATFPMIPERLSTDLTSLHQGRDRLAVVLDLVVDARRRRRTTPPSPGRWCCNRARLAYPDVGALAGGGGPAAAGGGRLGRAAGAAAAAGTDRRLAARPAPRARGAGAGDHRGPAGQRRPADHRPGAGAQERRPRSDRGHHAGGQLGAGRAVRVPGHLLDPAHRPFTLALAAAGDAGGVRTARRCPPSPAARRWPRSSPAGGRPRPSPSPSCRWRWSS